MADCTLCTIDNMRQVAQCGGQFVTAMPRTWKEDQQFRARLREYGVRWHPILTVPNRRRRADTPDVFSSCASMDTTADGYRIIGIRGPQKTAEDARTRERRLARAQAALRELNDKLPQHRDRTRRAVQRAVPKILRDTDTQRFLHVTIERQGERRRHYGRHGRPTADTSWSSNATSPIRPKKPRRAAGLLHAYFIALAVASPIEREVRTGMRRHGLKTLTLLPEYRPTMTPTCPRILTPFATSSGTRSNTTGEVVFASPIELSKLQRTLLGFLGVPVEA